MFAIFVSGLSGISSSSIVAVFTTDVVVSLFTTTSSVSSTLPPASTSTSSHTISFVSLLYPSIVSSFIVVPSGILSVTVTFPAAFPLLVRVIVYFIVSPTFASVLSAVLLPVMFALKFSVSFVGVSPTTAIFLMLPVTSLLTVTLNSIFLVSPGFTITSSQSIFPFVLIPLSVIEFSTRVVLAGIWSVTFVTASTFPVLVI